VSTVLFDHDAERAVAAVCLFSPGVTTRLMTDHGVRAAHFHNADFRQAFEALAALTDRGEAVDPLILRNELDQAGHRNPQGLVSHLLDGPLEAATVGTHAARVVSLAEWRRRTMAATELVAASQAMNADAFALAARQLDEHAAPTNATYTPSRWASLLYDQIAGQDAANAIPLPFAGLNEPLDGGLRPGELMLLAGYTSHGKSIVADQILDHAAQHGARVHLYMTEMTAAQRGLRLLARKTGIPMRKIKHARDLQQHDVSLLLAELELLPYGCTIAAGWGIDDVCRDIRRNRWDLAVIDLIHGFKYRDERDLSTISQAILHTTKASSSEHAGTAIVAVAHLNANQLKDSGRRLERPRPGLHSIKGASSLAQDADVVMFVWQQDDEEGVPSGEGEIWLAKSRQGGYASQAVHLNGQRMRFEAAA
jgi:replicative DNA helicase